MAAVWLRTDGDDARVSWGLTRIGCLQGYSADEPNRLAHCEQMNHSRAFWAVRNKFAEHMRVLWQAGYTGEGLWGRGALLTTGRFEHDTVRPDENLPEHLCGGTYRSRRRKRKAKTLSYQEQKEQRILKKFGANGVALGEDENTKRKLEKSRTIAAKPRVAGSKRGRELRAAAALARFDQVKAKEVEETRSVKTGDDDETASEAETESGDEYDDPANSGVADAVDINGTKLVDGKGHGMIKVCEDEDPEDQDAQRERAELQSKNFGTLDDWIKKEPTSSEPQEAKRQVSKPLQIPTKTLTSASGKTAPESSSRSVSRSKSEKPAAKAASSTPQPKQPSPSGTFADSPQPEYMCSMCSYSNGPLSVTCAICANVLDARNAPGSWSCASQACQGSKYLNAGDCGVCGICGQRRAAAD
jgi:DNA-dependent metalloprotease WSS1